MKIFEMRLVWKLLCFYLLSSPLQADLDLHASVADKESQPQKPRSWSLQQHSLALELVPHSPKEIKGFFIARGFPARIAEEISQQCVFQVVIKNSVAESSEAKIERPLLTVSLKQWRVRHQGVVKAMKLKEQWDAEWTQGLVSDAARLAFRWATFPSEQEFAPVGDYAWGMITVGLPPDEPFALQVVWQEGKQAFTQWIENMRCPKDY